MSECILSVCVKGTELQYKVPVGQLLLHVLFMAGLCKQTALCAGVGLCGRCAVQYLQGAPFLLPEEARLLGAEKTQAGWRLACRQLVREDCRVVLPSSLHASVKLERNAGTGLCVDVGTTRIKWSTVVSEEGQSPRVQAMLNPQMPAGSDVMARMQYALLSPETAKYLQTVLLEQLVSLAPTERAPCGVTGNAVMMALLCGVPVRGLASAPYSLPFHAGEEFFLHEKLPSVYIPPLIAPFVGADVSSDLAAICYRSELRYPFLLADLGTNAEFVVALNAQSFLTASVPMGPAIEGIGLSCGAPAGDDVVGAFAVSPEGVLAEITEGRAISGTGYISLLAQLRRLGILDEAGHFVEGTTPLARKMSRKVRYGETGRILDLGGGLFLAEYDVEEFLKVKAAFSVAVSSLLVAGRILPSSIQQVYLAGALGRYARTEDLFYLGFLPPVLKERVFLEENAALEGLRLALITSEVRAWLQTLPPLMRVLPLISDTRFHTQYVKAMRFVWE